MKIYENHAQDARYDEKDTCPTITSRYGTGGATSLSCCTKPHVFKLRSGCDGGGKGYLGSDDKTFTLATNNDQYVMTREPLGMTEYGNFLSIGEGMTPPLKARPPEPYTLEQTQARVRKLTPRECERLQGFPDDHTRIPWKGKSAEECPDSPRYKAIGNSWCIPCVRWIGERIQKELEKNK